MLLPALLILMPTLLQSAPRWIASAPLIMPASEEGHEIVAVKDPSVVRHGGLWHVFATTANTQGHWSMVYLNFKDWAQAGAARRHHLDANPGLRGYHCAPQVFYFRPQKKWYLIFQSGQPQYSTADSVDKPQAWSEPKDFFAGVPGSVVDKAWLDFWVIADEAHAYLFFTGDNGRFYRSRTKLKDFPGGMSPPEVVIERKKEDLFEAGATYKLKGQKGYLTLIEAVGPDWKRYYKAFTAGRLDGPWTDEGHSFEAPFAGIKNVAFEAGVKPWTVDISHGELLRDGYDERMVVDPRGLGFLFQGRDPASDGWPYHKLPYQLGVLREAGK